MQHAAWRKKIQKKSCERKGENAVDTTPSVIYEKMKNKYNKLINLILPAYLMMCNMETVGEKP